MRTLRIFIYVILYCGISTLYAQNPLLQVDGYIRLSPSNPININSLPGIIHYDANEGVFKGFNGATWVNLSLSAHSDQYNCPDPNTDMIVPEPKCITAMTVVLGKDGLTNIYAKEFDIGTDLPPIK